MSQKTNKNLVCCGRGAEVGKRDRDGHPSGEHTHKKDLTRGLLVTLTVEARDKEE